MPPSCNGALRSLSKGHACAAAFAEHALVGHFVVFRLAAMRFGGNLFEPQLALVGHCIRRARHCVCRLAAAGCACVRNVL